MNNRYSNKEKAKLDFLLQAYQSRIKYHSDQITRMWARFSFLLTIDLALFALFAGVLIGKKTSATAICFLVGMGFFISIVWYIYSAQDRYLFELYRKACDELEKKLIKKTKIKNFP